jgi:hypothetical protein
MDRRQAAFKGWNPRFLEMLARTQGR